MAAEEAVGGEDLEAGVGGRDEHDHHPRALRRSLLLGVGERRLVAVVPVGDQELAICECLGNALARKPPEPRVTGDEIRLTIGDGHGRLAVVEEEDRLELRLRGAQEAQPALLRAGVRPLVRQHGSGRVRLDPERGNETLAAACDPVRPDVVLSDGPDGRLVVLDEDALLEPGPKQPAGLVLGVVQRQVDDVVGIARAVVASASGVRTS